MIFTRYLYNADEVKITLLENLLNQKNLNECYFWIYEYYKSGFVKESWNLLYKIYYDFYALKNPKLLKKINLYYGKFKNNNDIKYILYIIKNLFKLKKNYDIFLLRIYHSSRNTRILKGDDIILNNYEYKNINEKKLVKAISQKDNEFIAYYLKQLINSKNLLNLLNIVLKKDIVTHDNYDIYPQLLFIIINTFKIQSKKKIFYRTIKDDEINNVLESDNNNFKEGIKDKKYISTRILLWLKNAPDDFEKIFPNPKNQIEYVMKQSYNDIEKALGNLWRDKDMVVGKEKEALLFFGLIMDEILLEFEKSNKTLKNKRLYSISDNISSCFKLDRNNVNLNKIFWYNWEYYAYKSPIWKKRFDKYDINIDDNKKIIKFNNEEEEEDFYRKFDYKPDEQSKETQEKSIKKFKKIDIIQWLNNIFTKQCKKNKRLKIIKINY